MKESIVDRVQRLKNENTKSGLNPLLFLYVGNSEYNEIRSFVTSCEEKSKEVNDQAEFMGLEIVRANRWNFLKVGA